MILLF